MNASKISLNTVLSARMADRKGLAECAVFNVYVAVETLVAGFAAWLSWFFYFSQRR